MKAANTLQLLKKAGAVVRTLEYTGTVHGFVGLPGGFSVSDRALTEACAALRQLVFQDPARPGSLGLPAAS